MVTSPGFPEYLYGRDGRREVLSEADAALSIGMEVRMEENGRLFRTFGQEDFQIS